MNTRGKISRETTYRSIAQNIAQKQIRGKPSYNFTDDRPVAIAQRRLIEMAEASSLQKRPAIDHGAGGKEVVNPIGNNAIVQRRLVSANNVTMKKVEDLQLPAWQNPTPELIALLSDKQKFYLPKNPDFQSSNINVLEEKKYLLGETHGDGSWETRTKKWGHIQKMLEGLKGFRPEDGAHQQAITSTGKSMTGKSEQMDNIGPSLPLEDMHAYALTRMLMLQQSLNNHKNLILIPDGKKLLGEEIREVFQVMSNYIIVGNAWQQQMTGKPADRENDFLEVGYKYYKDKEPAWLNIRAIGENKKLPESLIPKEIKSIQTILKAAIEKLMNLIDTRPLDEGIFSLGILKSKIGDDPISNRKEIASMSETGGSGISSIKALEQGNILREKAMTDNIRSAKGPLLVQVGNAHVDRLAKSVGATAVPVKKGTDFDQITRKYIGIDSKDPFWQGEKLAEWEKFRSEHPETPSYIS